MKRFIILLLLLLFVLQCSMKTIIVTMFKVRQDYIIKTLCENKQKPQLHCNGKCYLKKKLDAENKQEQNLPNFLKEKIELSIIASVYAIKFAINEHVLAYNYCYILKPYTTILTAVFHPPSI